MGTRSNVTVTSDGRRLVSIYRQFDGYPTGMGRDLLDILNGGDVELLNGFGMGSKTPEQFNGMMCLAAYVVHKLKESSGESRGDGNTIGNVYLYPTDHRPGDAGEEYWYDLAAHGGRLYLTLYSLPWGDGEPALMYEGPLADFNPEKIESDGGE